MNLKRLFALVLALAFVVVLAASCSKTEGTQTETGTGTSTVTLKKDAEGNYDLGGITVSYVLRNGQNPWAWSPWKDNLPKLMSKCNFNLALSDAPNDDEVVKIINETLAGKPRGDIIMIPIDGGRTYPLIAANVLTPWSDSSLFNKDHPNYDPVAIENSTVDGKIYGVREKVLDLTAVFCYNKEILSAAGITDPQQQIANGTWSYESLVEIAEKCTKDLDGDGTLDQYAFYSDNGALEFIMTLAFCNGAELIKLQDGDIKKPYFAGDSDAFTEAMEYAERICAAHGVYNNELGVGGEDLFNQGKLAVMNEQGWRIKGGYITLDGSKWSIVPWPQGPSATKLYSWTCYAVNNVVPKTFSVLHGNNIDQLAAAWEMWVDWYWFGGDHTGETFYDLTRSILENYISDDTAIDNLLNYVKESTLVYNKAQNYDVSSTWYDQMKSEFVAGTADYQTIVQQTADNFNQALKDKYWDKWSELA